MGEYIRHRELPAGKEESMMDDTKRALLGDHEAAKRLTDAGGAATVSTLQGTCDTGRRDTSSTREIQCSVR